MDANLTLFDVGINTVQGFDCEDPICLNDGMNIVEIRRSNLAALCKRLTDGNVTRFGELIKRSQSATSDLLLGRKSFGEKMARSIEDHLGLPKNYLDNINVFVSEDGENVRIEGGPNVTPGPDVIGKVPLISWVQAGQFCASPDLFQPGDAEDWIPTIRKYGPHAYALRVVGDSMVSDSPLEKTYPPGTIIFVDPEKPVSNGCKVVAKIHDSGDATFKKYSEDAGTRYLRPLNKDYPTIIMDDTMIICGVVVGSYQEE